MVEFSNSFFYKSSLGRIYVSLPEAHKDLFEEDGWNVRFGALRLTVKYVCTQIEK
jgi:hypothetical protein